MKEFQLRGKCPIGSVGESKAVTNGNNKKSINGNKIPTKYLVSHKYLILCGNNVLILIITILLSISSVQSSLICHCCLEWLCGIHHTFIQLIL